MGMERAATKILKIYAHEDSKKLQIFDVNFDLTLVPVWLPIALDVPDQNCPDH